MRQPADSRSAADGLVLNGVLLTAAARCAPPDNRPTREELERCQSFLEAELAVLGDLRVVLALGRVAFDAVLAAWPRGRGVAVPPPWPRFGHGREALLPAGRGRGEPITLLASYHPSRQHTNTGRLTREAWLGVFERVRVLLAASAPAGEGVRRARSRSC